MPIALGIDFEHIHHTPAYRSLSNPDPITIDIPSITSTILDLLDTADVSVTFFIVSDFIDNHKETIETIADRGHEVAAHTRSHRSLTGLDVKEQRREIVQSKIDLESIVEQPVRGFRAPTCQINDGIYQTLSEVGYEYSTSVMPSLPIPGFYSTEYEFTKSTRVLSGQDSLIEVPLSVHPWLRLPVSGAWIRLLGRQYTHHGFQSILDRGGNVLTYSHPWEFVALQETALPFRNRVRTGDWFVETFEQLLSFDSKYCTVSELKESTTPVHQYEISTA